MITTHANRCPTCRRTFTTPQGLGLHFMHLRRSAKLRAAHRKAAR